jgi:hypothetical protein
VSFPGRTSLVAQTALLNHCIQGSNPHNRVAIVDFADTASRTTLVTAAVALRGLPARFGSGFAPWAVVPGVTPGTFRTVPYSAVQAGLIARNDATYSCNVPSAGDLGISRYAVGLSQAGWNDTDRDALNNAGVNVALVKYGSVRTYGYRTLVNKDTDTNYIGLGGARMLMQLSALGDQVMESHVFDPIDGQGLLFGVINGELMAMINPFYADGSLYGATPDLAFNVDTSNSVNTPTTIANQEIHATIAVRTSPMGELVELDLVKVSVANSL